MNDFIYKIINKIIHQQPNDDMGKLIFIGLEQTLKLVLVSSITATICSFLLGCFLYKIHLKKNKIQKWFYNTITKTIEILTHIPFLFLGLISITIISDYDKMKTDGGNFLLACVPLTLFLTLHFAIKIEKLFAHHTKNHIEKIIKIIHNIKIITQLIRLQTSLLILGILYSTIAGGSFGGKFQNDSDIKGIGLGAVAYNYVCSKERKEAFMMFIICLIIIIILIQSIRCVGLYLSKKIPNKIKFYKRL